MSKPQNSSELIYEYLKGSEREGLIVSKLPTKLQRQLVTQSVQKIVGGITRNLAIADGTVLDQANYNEQSPHEVTTIVPAELHTLVINDLAFEVLPTQIGIQYQTHSFKSNTIRSQGPVKTKTGRGVISIQLQLVFVGLNEINTQLRRLIAQARIMPFWYISNDFIRGHVYPEDTIGKPGGVKKNIGVVLNAMSVSTHPEAVETLVATLSMEVFNWEVYSRQFYFVGTAGKMDNKPNAKKLAVKSPGDSNLFSLYWDSILSDYDSITLDKNSVASVLNAKYEEVEAQINQISLPLYRTPDSYKFPMIISNTFESFDVLNITYSTYKVIPEEVIKQLTMDLNSEKTKTNGKDITFQAVNKNKLNQEYGITTQTKLKVEETRGYLNETSFVIKPHFAKIIKTSFAIKPHFAKIIEFARGKQFLGKPYVSDPENRDATDYYDCSSYVYNVLKNFGLNFGTYTASQRYNINNIIGNPIVAGSREQVVSEIGNGSILTDFTGYLIFCFKNFNRLSDKQKAQASEANKIVTLSSGKYVVGHVAFIEDVTTGTVKKNFTDTKINLLHAFSSGVGNTGMGGVKSYDYFEVYPIPGVDYGATSQTVLPKDVKERVDNLLKNANTVDVNAALNRTNVSGLTGAPQASQVKSDPAVRLYEASKKYGQSLAKALSNWLKLNSKVWKLVWLRNGTFLLEKKNTLTVNNKSQYRQNDSFVNYGPVLQHVAININNTFARIPMSGHELVTHQYLGGGDCDVVLHFQSVGQEFLNQLQIIRKYTEAAARNFRFLDDVGSLEFFNPIIQLAGSKKFIIESIESKTNPDSPELYDVTLHISEMRNAPRDSEAFKQEFVASKTMINSFIEGLVKTPLPNSNLLSTLTDRFQTLKTGNVHVTGKIPFELEEEKGGATYPVLKLYSNLTPNYRILNDGQSNLLGPTILPSVRQLSKGWTDEQFNSYSGLNIFINYIAEGKIPAKTKQEYLKLMISALTTSFLTKALQLFQPLGITESDLKKWSKDSKHPLYSYGIFDQLDFKYPKDIKTYAFDPQIQGWNDANILFNYSKRKTEEIFNDVVALQKFVLQIPFKGNFQSDVAQEWSAFVGTLKNIALSIGVAGKSWFRALAGFGDGSEFFARKDVELLSQISGSELLTATKAFVPFLKISPVVLESADDPSATKEYVTTKVTIESDSSLKMLELQVKARLSLYALFSQFRSVMKTISNIAMPALKYTDQFSSLLQVKDTDSFSFHGLPAYQDIPVPYINFEKPEYKSIRQNLIDNDIAFFQYMNPDFFFFNEGDENQLNTRHIGNAFDNAARLMNANSILANSFGILPNEKEPRFGPSAYGGGAGSKNAASGVGNTSTPSANQLPDSLIDQYFPTLMGRTVGATASATGVNTKGNSNKFYAIAPNRLVGNPLPPGKEVEAGKPHPHYPNMTSVSFGPMGGVESRLGVVLDRSPETSLSHYTRSAIAKNSSPFRMRRALPAVKLYFIEDDTSGIGGSDPSSYVRSFDDFFSYKAIKEVKMISSRKFPAKLVIIRLSNLYGNLDSLQFSNTIDPNYERTDKTNENVIEQISYDKLNTPQENPFTRFILKEGVRVQLKGGFENNPGAMDVVFSGQIAQINQESGDEVVIVCQDFGTQLVADVKGTTKDQIKHQWIDTFDLISWLITQPEMTYFGRWTLDVERSIGESRSTGGWEKLFRFLEDPRDDNLFVPTREQMINHFSDEAGGLFSNLFFLIRKNLLVPNTSVGVDGNKTSVKPIAVVGGRQVYLIESPKLTVDSLGSGDTKKTPGMVLKNNSVSGDFSYEYKLGNFGFKGFDYVIYRQTIWDIFKEMELRHPGWIGHPIEYGNRMTMFFGQPTQPYWFRPPNGVEAASMFKQSQEIQKKLQSSRLYRDVVKQINNTSGQAGLLVASKVKEYSWYVFDAATLALALYGSYQSLGAGTATSFALREVVKRTVKGIAVGLLTYNLTSTSGNQGWVGTLGSAFAGFAASGFTVFGYGGQFGKELLKKMGKIGIAGAAVAGASLLTGTAAGVLEATNNIIALTTLREHLKSQIINKSIQKQISGRLKQFRDYHIVNSQNNIVANQIKSTNHNIYNTVTLEYVGDSTSDLQGDKLFSATKENRLVKASHRILDKDTRMGFFSYPNCRGLWMADRYAQGLLMRHMKDAYQGQLIVLGDWSYKPYDRVLIQDDFLGMYGQIEIEQVVHTLSPEVGFITEITPDMVVYGNQIVDMVYDNFMSGYSAWRQMSWTDTIEAVLKNDPQKFFARMQQSQRGKNGELLGIGTGNANNPSGFTEVEARALNSIPSLFGLSLFFGLGAGAATFAGGGSVGAGVATGAAAATAIGAGTVATSTNKPLNVQAGADRSTFGNIGKYIQYKLFGSLALKFYEWSTSRQPLLFEPLYVNEKPMLPTIDMDKVSMFQNIEDQFVPVLGNLSRGFQVLQEAGKMFIYSDISNKLKELE